MASGIKFTSSGSSSTGQNPLLVKMTKFGKGKDTKEEKRSPSTQRGKSPAGEAAGLCDEDAIEAATPTQGVADQELSLEQVAEADRKRHKSAIDGDNADATDSAETDEKMLAKAEEVDFNVLLEKERQKRRDVEDALDEVKNEMGWQREALAKATHSLSRVIHSSLQSAERADQITIYVVKKKAEKARAFFDGSVGIWKASEDIFRQLEAVSGAVQVML